MAHKCGNTYVSVYTIIAIDRYSDTEAMLYYEYTKIRVFADNKEELDTLIERFNKMH